jgi:NAD(P)-dependent dehydrogenase (short-subunit alcohol dehydrogenase family)
MRIPRRFEGRVALVTGAGGGQGAATARRLAAEGAALHLLDLTEEPLAGVAGGIARDGGVATFSVADVASPEAVERAVAECADAHGRLDAVVNNAGVYTSTPITEITVEEWDRVFAVNLDGAFRVVQRCVPLLAEDGGGAITNTTSVYGLIGDTWDTLAPYAASKAGLATLTRQLAIELAPLGIRANAVCPGMVDTPMNDVWKADGSMWDRFLETKIPMRRAASAEELAAVHAFLLSGEASYVTGALLHADGGWLAM